MSSRCVPSGALSAREEQTRASGQGPFDSATVSVLTPSPSVLQVRREKMAFFDTQCSCIADGLYLGSDAVARSRQVLAEQGITHVLNATAYSSPEYFRPVSGAVTEASCALSASPPQHGGTAADGGPALQYFSLWLQDTPGEDLLCVLYDACDWLDAVRRGGGRVLVHCSQGVSRSAALCIAYLMHTQGATFDDAFNAVKSIRGVASPNMGFACQLLQWAKRRGCSPEMTRLYRMQPHSPADPRYVVPRQVPVQPGSNHDGRDAVLGMAALLDARAAFVIHHRGSPTFVWHGAACAPAFADAAWRFAEQLARYEGAPAPAMRVQCGREPPELLHALGVGASHFDACRMHLASHELRCSAYDDDFAMFFAGKRCDLAVHSGVGAQDNHLDPLSPRFNSLALGPSQPAFLPYVERPRSARHSMPALHWPTQR